MPVNTSPSGEQFEIEAAGYRAVITESGAALRVLDHTDHSDQTDHPHLTRTPRPLIDGFTEAEASYGGRGQLLMPWTNRIEDGQYEFEGRAMQLGLSEPGRHNASHGLVRWAAWTLEEHTRTSVSMTYRLMAQPGYPWLVDLHVLYDVSAEGLTVTQTATNLSPEAAPYACGAHPYLSAGPGPIDTWSLQLPARTRILTDPERNLPIGTESVLDTDFDFREARPIGALAFDHAFGDLERDDAGVATVTVRHGDSGEGTLLWVDRHHRWLQVYSADDAPDRARRSLAVEPMTAPAGAFRSGEDLLTLAPSGRPGDEISVSWGIRAVA